MRCGRLWRGSLAFLLGLLGMMQETGRAADTATAVDRSLAQSDAATKTDWYAAHSLGMEGQGWSTDLAAPFDRFPKQAEGKVRAAVWGLSRHSAGLAVRFRTNSAVVRCRWTLTSPNLAMPHMPATGVSGVDLYLRHPELGWRWAANGRPAAQTNDVALVSNLPAGEHDCLVYLPLYNGVQKLEIGVAQNAAISRLERSAENAKPIVFYGTSITQGGCASRPGMVHTAILGRRLDRPVINLGFSGNGKMEAEVGDFLTQLDAAVYVIDCLPNMNGKDVSERTIPLVRQIRKARPDTPIVLAEDRSYADSAVNAGRAAANAGNRAALKQAFEDLLKEGVKKLTYLPGATQLGADGEDTVDGSHPTDLGFQRMADAFEGPLREALK